jgi:hypothetical protein
MANEDKEVHITIVVLDALNTGKHDLKTVQWARRVLEAAGLKVARHQLELQEAQRLRGLARTTLLQADKLDGKASGVQEMEREERDD